MFSFDKIQKIEDTSFKLIILIQSTSITTKPLMHPVLAKLEDDGITVYTLTAISPFFLKLSVFPFTDQHFCLFVF